MDDHDLRFPRDDPYEGETWVCDIEDTQIRQPYFTAADWYYCPVCGQQVIDHARGEAEDAE